MKTLLPRILRLALLFGASTAVSVAAPTAIPLVQGLTVGVGYALPQVVVKAINEFLSLFHVKEISSSYSKPIASVPIYEDSKAIPPTCGKP